MCVCVCVCVCVSVCVKTKYGIWNLSPMNIYIYIYIYIYNDSREIITVKFELEMHKEFHAIPIRFCSRLLATGKMTHCVKIDKIKCFLMP